MDRRTFLGTLTAAAVFTPRLTWGRSPTESKNRRAATPCRRMKRATSMARSRSRRHRLSRVEFADTRPHAPAGSRRARP